MAVEQNISIEITPNSVKYTSDIRTWKMNNFVLKCDEDGQNFHFYPVGATKTSGGYESVRFEDVVTWVLNGTPQTYTFLTAKSALFDNTVNDSAGGGGTPAVTIPPTYKKEVSYITAAGLQTLPANTVSYSIINLGDGTAAPTFPSATWLFMGVSHNSNIIRSFSEESGNGAFVPAITFNGLGNTILLEIKTKN